jgi:hypothetical protein
MSDSEHSDEGDEGRSGCTRCSRRCNRTETSTKSAKRSRESSAPRWGQSVARYLRHTAAREVRSIEATLRDPPAIADAEAAETRASVRRDLFEHLIARHLRGPALEAAALDADFFSRRSFFSAPISPSQKKQRSPTVGKWEPWHKRARGAEESRALPVPHGKP